jgi:hypothetical protein
MNRDQAIAKFDQPWKFEAGAFTTTPGVLGEMRERFGNEDDGVGYLVACWLRHRQGDWGDVDDEDAGVNDRAVEEGGRLISAYPIDPDGERKGWGDNAIWLITDADRSSTTAMLPREY